MSKTIDLLKVIWIASSHERIQSSLWKFLVNIKPTAMRNHNCSISTSQLINKISNTIYNILSLYKFQVSNIDKDFALNSRCQIKILGWSFFWRSYQASLWKEGVIVIVNLQTIQLFRLNKLTGLVYDKWSGKTWILADQIKQVSYSILEHFLRNSLNLSTF
jgi:hypothetical protein